VKRFVPDVPSLVDLDTGGDGFVETQPCFLPRRFFASEASERSFISAPLAHMTSEARDRSAEAVAFCGIWD
jgi:hypothetical protein